MVTAASPKEKQVILLDYIGVDLVVTNAKKWGKIEHISQWMKL